MEPSYSSSFKKQSASQVVAVKTLSSRSSKQMRYVYHMISGGQACVNGDELTISSQAFPITAACIWNALPRHYSIVC